MFPAMGDIGRLWPMSPHPFPPQDDRRSTLIKWIGRALQPAET